MRTESFTLAADSDFDNETFVVTLQDTAEAETGTTLTSVGSAALVTTANKFYVLNNNNGSYAFVASVATDFDGYFHLVSANIDETARTEPDDTAEADTVSKTISYTVTDVATGDPASVVAVRLSDPDETYGARRVSTGTIVAANDTALTSNGGGNYTITLTGLTPGADYEYWLEREFADKTLRTRRTFTAPSATGDGWYYADTQAVMDLLGTANLEIVSDLEDTVSASDAADGNLSTAQAAVVIRAGTKMDGYIDLRLRKAGLTAPNPLTDTAIAAVLEQASAHLAVWYLWHHRGLQEVRQGTDEIAGIMEGYKAYADSLLDGVVNVLETEDVDDDAVPAGTFSFIPTERGVCSAACDENAE